MRIVDYETNRDLSDVAVYLDREEILDLLAYLSQLARKPAVHRVHLSEIVGPKIERELTVAISNRKAA